MDMINLRNLYVEKIFNNLNAIENQMNINQYGGSSASNDCDDNLITKINNLLSENESIMEQLINKLESTKDNKAVADLEKKLKDCIDCKDKYNKTLTSVKNSLEGFKKTNKRKLDSLQSI